MLLELRIRDYAIISRASVRLAPGLNVLTGETGAGKSIIVGALSLLLGERATTDVVRTGAERAVVEGVFDVAGRPELHTLLDEHGLEAEEGLLILRREVALEGRNRAWVNGSAATATLVGDLGRRLVDLHGQHEHQTLLRPEEQRTLLDAFSGAREVAAEVRAAYGRLRQAGHALEHLEAKRQAVAERAELLRLQAEEIEKAAVRDGEEEALEREARRLGSAEELAGLAGRLQHELYGAEDAIAARLDTLRRVLDQLIRIDPDQEPAREALESAYHALQELGRQMGDYAAGIEYDPGRLEAVRRRQDLLYRLRSRFGPTLADVLETGRRARAELSALDEAGLRRGELERELAAARSAFETATARLSELRRAGADRLAAEVRSLLPQLGMPGGRFEVALRPLAQTGAAGAENVEFRISLNEGFETRPLARVASGGELSRVMLALKTVLVRLDRVPSLVFDEIDAGIGGRVAHRIGERLHEVARSHQVFVITHLAQIAARADHHLRVEKEAADGRTATVVEALEGEERVREIARMLGGAPDRGAGLEHAREMLSGGVSGEAAART